MSKKTMEGGVSVPGPATCRGCGREFPANHGRSMLVASHALFHSDTGEWIVDTSAGLNVRCWRDESGDTYWEYIDAETDEREEVDA